MTLERKAQLRRTELRRTTPMPRAKRARKVAGRRDTGPTQVVKDALWVRAGGCCEVCGKRITGEFSRHHRRPRGNGGSSRPDTNQLTNLLLLCGSATTTDGCHARIESQRTMARGYGWLLRQHQDPAAEPVLVRGALVWLTSTGEYASRPEEAG